MSCFVDNKKEYYMKYILIYVRGEAKNFFLMKETMALKSLPPKKNQTFRKKLKEEKINKSKNMKNPSK